MNLNIPYTIPEDLDSFWSEVKSEVEAVPLEYARGPAEIQSETGHVLERIRFLSVQDHVVDGWIAFPASAHRLPSFIWVPPYGRESLLPNKYGTREGMTSMSFNLHGEDAFHQEKYVKERGYFADGVGEPGTWIFRKLVQHVLMATRVLQAQSEVDEDRMGLMGMSQGAGLSLWSGGLSHRVKAICSDMPFLGQMDFALTRNAHRYPLKELIDYMEATPFGRERVMHTLSYYDTAHLATRCTLPIQVSYGLKDPACRPETVNTIFEAIPTNEKRLIEYPGGHDWHDEMVEHNRAWLLSHF